MYVTDFTYENKNHHFWTKTGNKSSVNQQTSIWWCKKVCEEQPTCGPLIFESFGNRVIERCRDGIKGERVRTWNLPYQLVKLLEFFL